FLAASAVWAHRGGRPAKVMGSRFWNAPPGCPLAVTPSEGVPDFGARAQDPAFGGAVPEGKLHDGPRQLVFEGYATDKAGMPTFRYRLNADEFQPVEVTERPAPLRSPVAAGVARRFTLQVPAQQKAWLWAGEARGEPRLLDKNGPGKKLDWMEGTAEMPAAGQLLVLPQGGDKVIILAVVEAPQGTRWYLSRKGGGWQVLLRVPSLAEAGKVHIGLHIWAPYRDEPDLLKELVSMK